MVWIVIVLVFDCGDCVFVVYVVDDVYELLFGIFEEYGLVVGEDVFVVFVVVLFDMLLL